MRWVEERKKWRQACDCSLMALALAAHQYNLVCPTISDENVLQIEEGRHPLQVGSPTLAVSLCYVRALTLGFC